MSVSSAQNCVRIPKFCDAAPTGEYEDVEDEANQCLRCSRGLIGCRKIECLHNDYDDDVYSYNALVHGLWIDDNLYCNFHFDDRNRWLDWGETTYLAYSGVVEPRNTNYDVVRKRGFNAGTIYTPWCRPHDIALIHLPHNVFLYLSQDGFFVLHLPFRRDHWEQPAIGTEALAKWVRHRRGITFDGVPVMNGIRTILTELFDRKKIAHQTLNSIGEISSLNVSFHVRFKEEVDLVTLQKILSSQGWVCDKRFEYLRRKRGYWERYVWLPERKARDRVQRKLVRGNLAQIDGRLKKDGMDIVHSIITRDSADLRFSLDFSKSELLAVAGKLFKTIKTINEYETGLENVIFADCYDLGIVRPSEQVIAIDVFNQLFMTLDDMGQIYFYCPYSDEERGFWLKKRVSSKMALKYISNGNLHSAPEIFRILLRRVIPRDWEVTRHRSRRSYFI